MNQPVISALAGLAAFGVFAAVVRLLPRRFTTPTPPTQAAPCMHQGEPHLCLICQNGARR